jgi:hypothetical protein
MALPSYPIKWSSSLAPMSRHEASGQAYVTPQLRLRTHRRNVFPTDYSSMVFTPFFFSFSGEVFTSFDQLSCVMEKFRKYRFKCSTVFVEKCIMTVYITLGNTDTSLVITSNKESNKACSPTPKPNGPRFIC